MILLVEKIIIKLKIVLNMIKTLITLYFDKKQIKSMIMYKDNKK